MKWREGRAMLRFEGDRKFSKPPAEVFARLSDARFLVPCVPDVSSTKSLGEDAAEIVLRPGFAFIRGTLDVRLERTALEPPTRVVWKLTSRGIGTSSEVEATLTLAEAEGGTATHWAAEVKSLGGLLKLVPGGLIRGAAERVINDAWDRIEKAM
jgi:carbon monoxide dehydrogenase subunit G